MRMRCKERSECNIMREAVLTQMLFLFEQVNTQLRVNGNILICLTQEKSRSLLKTMSFLFQSHESQLKMTFGIMF